MLYIHVTHSSISGSAVAEEGWHPCLQHMYGDSGRERRTGCLGPSDVSLPFTSASGESGSPRHKELWVSSDHHILSFPLGAPYRSRRHAGSWAVAWTAAPPPEVPPRAELGPEGNGGPSPPQSQQGHHWVLYRQVPENLTRGHVFVLTSLQTGTAVFILGRRHASVGRCWQKTLVLLPRHSCSLKTAGHVGISSVNTETRKEGWRAHVGTEWMSAGKCSSAGVATTTVTTPLQRRQRIGSIQQLGSGSSDQKGGGLERY